ncbi:unnamed protein product [Miscanthus lutarioriparius]|uniref:Neprosin PEP catalytic domain-containing protein n=1 Tax=Miscanthus lutarioriparius TaxID=422564 RepID=A0A811P4C4_9POAL|nr:unnamed protein product [Miscanthus lutarioriparius]
MAAASSSSCSRGRVLPIIASLVPFLLLLVVVSCPAALASATHGHGGGRKHAAAAAARAHEAVFRARDEREAYRRIMARMARMAKDSNMTIQSPDGDVIHCVPADLQPAFDHPMLRGQKPEDEPVERPVPKGGGGGGAADEEDEEEEAGVFPQAWSDGGKRCPEGRWPYFACLHGWGGGTATATTAQHAVGYVTGDQFYGAKASLNVWSAKVASAAEFSLSQIWVISGSFGNDLNTIEAGWQVSPELYGDSNLRFFTYWTTDAYQETGCYNLHCSGFVQTNNRIAIGAAISPTSVYNGRQFDISLLIWKLGSGPLVGYWPSLLFTHLGGHANMVQFGGEVVNSRPSGSHTSTQMGSGHFPREGFNHAAYFRNVQVVDGDNSLVPAAALRLVADHPGCYDIQGNYNRAWGNYFTTEGPAGMCTVRDRSIAGDHASCMAC